MVRFHLFAIKGEDWIPAWLEKMRYLYMLGAYLNPVIYTLINKSFRDFLLSLLRQRGCVYERGNLSNQNTVGDKFQAPPVKIATTCTV